MSERDLKRYLETFISAAGNDGEPWRRVPESDYSPYPSIVNKEGEPILEIAFNMRDGEPFIVWDNCCLAELFLELPVTIPEIIERAIKAETLNEDIAKKLESELSECVSEDIIDQAFIAGWNSALEVALKHIKGALMQGHKS